MIVAVRAYSIVQVDTVTRINAFWSPESSASARLWRVAVVIDAWERLKPAAGSRRGEDTASAVGGDRVCGRRRAAGRIDGVARVPGRGHRYVGAIESGALQHHRDRQDSVLPGKPASAMSWTSRASMLRGRSGHSSKGRAVARARCSTCSAWWRFRGKGWYVFSGPGSRRCIPGKMSYRSRLPEEERPCSRVPMLR